MTCVGVISGICKQFTTYALIGCFRRNAHYVLREMLVATNNPGTHNEYMCVANCRHCIFLWTFCKESMNNTGPSSGQFRKISEIAVNQPQQSYQWGINNGKSPIRKTKPRRVECGVFLFYEVGTAVCPREFYHFVSKANSRGKIPVAIPRFVLGIKKDRHSIRRGLAFLMVLLPLFIPHW